jgi:hypothetical protein
MGTLRRPFFFSYFGGLSILLAYKKLGGISWLLKRFVSCRHKLEQTLIPGARRRQLLQLPQLSKSARGIGQGLLFRTGLGEP